MAPDPESAKAAVETLRAELELVNGSLESIDRKAALVPATLGIVAGIFIGPGGTFTVAESAILLVAIATGIVAVFCALRVMWARRVSVGPDAKTTANGTHYGPADFNNAVAGSLALSVDKLSAVAIWKSTRLNVAFWFAGTTILLLAVARLVGGMWK